MGWLLDIAELLIGLVVLALGGEGLVKGAAQLARSLGVPALIVGLTVVAFGTSTPEVAVTLVAGGKGEDQIAVANVVGSCTMNILIVLGLAALARPLRVSRSIIHTDGPIMVGALAIFLLFAIDGWRIERWMGVTFLILLAVYTGVTALIARRQARDPLVAREYREEITPGRSRAINLLLIVLGIAALIIGGNQIVNGAIGIAQALGISRRVIGLTIVALGTSLPEVATCVIAAYRNHPDIAIGNVVGSNIFNIFAVLGITATVFPLDVSRETLYVDAPVMLAAGVIAVLLCRTGRRISRVEGGVLLGLYACYLVVMNLW